jgi:hypothetical protein
MVYPLDESAGAWGSVVQVLIRPEHLSPVQFCCIEQIEIDSFDSAVPSLIPARPAFPMMLQQPVTAGIAVMVEGDDTIRRVDVVSPKALVRDDPLRMKSRKRGAIEEHACEDVAGAMAEEDAIGQRPSSLRVLLDSGFEDIHVAGIVDSALA